MISLVIQINNIFKKFTKSEKNKADLNAYINAGNESNIIKYSKATSKRYGFTGGEEKYFKRPCTLRRKGENEITRMAKENAKINSKKYAQMFKTLIPLKEMYDSENITNKTIRVYCESLFINNEGVNYKLIDDTAIYTLIQKKAHDIVGNFVWVNFNKLGNQIKVNYILTDN